MLHDFWKRFYYPGNATLYVVGDFDAGGGMDAAEQLIQDTFGKIPTGPRPGSGAPGPLRQQQQLVGTCSLLPSAFPKEKHLQCTAHCIVHCAAHCKLHCMSCCTLQGTLHYALHCLKHCFALQAALMLNCTIYCTTGCTHVELHNILLIHCSLLACLCGGYLPVL